MAARDAEVAGAQPGNDPRRWRAFLVTQAGGFMVLLDVTIVTVAVPSIQSGLDASASGVQWVVSGYPLMFGLALVAGGRLGDAFGRRRMYLIALTGFVVTSAAAGAAPSLTLLVVARLLQGVAGGFITPQNLGLIQDMFRGAERSRAFGMLGATLSVSTAVGPVVGGLLIGGFGEPDGWRWVFLVNVPLGVLALILAARLVPRIERGSGATEIDVAGIVLLGLAVLGVLLPVVQSEDGGLSRLWWMFPVAGVFLLAFVRWQRRRMATGRAPVVDLRLFTEVVGYRAGSVLGAVYFAGFSGVWLVFALYFQVTVGLSALVTGLVLTPYALGGVSAALAGRVLHRWGRWVTVAGLSLVTVGFAAVALIGVVLPADQVAGWVLFPLLLAGIGGGAVIAPNTALTMTEVPARMAGVSAGLLQTGQRIGAALGTALLAAVFHAAGMPASVLCAVGLVLVALALAIRELCVSPRRDILSWKVSA
ncbi:MAG TPA: MFS transporter [Actinophytocola sp.]|uniref:MFS transporter n=1 Tax=Actinophytocola sp. TaxID=1872138 RepID=UPI002DB74640|nr:MFS transporter [Actinophytocola sp.]HEU5475202.1 MFS transporter [Actinophytocola sp.]